jgi:serine/threonine-protein kinase
VSLTPPFLLLDRYDVSAQIGRGGHAIVYRAHDRVFDRAVAIKLLRDDALSPDVLARFRQEIQLTARLEHAHILHVYDTGTFEGLPFVVMELASGQTLADRMTREGPLPVADALQITRDVGLALAHAHARGIVHRDVKPENILLGSGGAMLADFGVARVTADQAVQRLTSTGMAVGTLQYMSPEQLCAEPQIDDRSDQYALACVLYEMLAGVRPHASASLEGLRMLRLTAQHVPVSVHRPSVPAEIDEALQVALAVAPADRFRSVEAFLAALGVTHTGDLAVPRAPGSSASRSGARSGRGMSPVQAAAVVTGSARRRWGLGLGLVGVTAAALVWQGAPPVDSDDQPGSAGETGTLTVALAPVSKGADSLDVELRARVRDELSAWSEVRVADRGAALQLTVRAQRLGDSVQLRLEALAPAVRSTDDRATPRHRVIRMTNGLSPASWTSMVPSMVREALSGRPLDLTPGLDAMPGRSLTVLRAYVLGFDALRAGLLDSAASVFRRARSAEPKFTSAFFWAAQSSAWSAPREPALWQTDAEEAARRSDLKGVDSLLAAGLGHLARATFPEACAAYRLATHAAPQSFVAWYGLGMCTQLDAAVIFPGPRTAQFRSSIWAALEAYGEAVEHAPTAEWLGALFGPILRSTYAGGVETRVGTGVSRRDRFYALPGLAADTFVFEPTDSARFVQGAAGTVPATWDAAVRRGRALVLELTARWTQRFPAAPVAWYYRAIALELSGALSRRDEPSAEAALDSVEGQSGSALLRDRARVARIRLALRRGALDTAVSLALAIPFDTASGQLTPARRRLLAPLAAFAGEQAVLRETLDAGEQARPLPIRAPLRNSYASALLGDCVGLRADYDVLERALDAAYPQTQRTAERRAILVPVLRLAVPCFGPEPLRAFNPSSSPLDSVHLALARRDRDGARRQLATLRRRRAGAVTAAMSWDYIFAESWALQTAGDSVAAIRQIVTGLDGLSSMSVYTLDQVEYAAGLRRSILLLSDLIEYASVPAQNDTLAALWQSAAEWVEKSAALRVRTGKSR